MELRKIEEAKAYCAREHFRAISGENVVYNVVDSYDRLCLWSVKIRVRPLSYVRIAKNLLDSLVFIATCHGTIKLVTLHHNVIP